MTSADTKGDSDTGTDAIATGLETLPLSRFEKERALLYVALGRRMAAALISAAHAARLGYAALMARAMRARSSN